MLRLVGSVVIPVVFDDEPEIAGHEVESPDPPSAIRQIHLQFEVMVEPEGDEYETGERLHAGLGPDTGQPRRLSQLSGSAPPEALGEFEHLLAGEQRATLRAAREHEMVDRDDELPEREQVGALQQGDCRGHHRDALDDPELVHDGGSMTDDTGCAIGGEAGCCRDVQSSIPTNGAAVDDERRGVAHGFSGAHARSEHAGLPDHLVVKGGGACGDPIGPHTNPEEGGFQGGVAQGLGAHPLLQSLADAEGRRQVGDRASRAGHAAILVRCEPP